MFGMILVYWGRLLVVSYWLLVAGGALQWGENFSGGGGARGGVVCASRGFFQIWQNEAKKNAVRANGVKKGIGMRIAGAHRSPGFREVQVVGSVGGRVGLARSLVRSFSGRRL